MAKWNINTISIYLYKSVTWCHTGKQTVENWFKPNDTLKPLAIVNAMYENEKLPTCIQQYRYWPG